MKKTPGFEVLRGKLKSLKPAILDKYFHTFHEEVFAEINCMDCGACCKTISPAMRDVDLLRMAKPLKMKPSEIFETYMKKDDEGDYVFRSSPCPFLGSDNACSIYDYRPRACREYPHTDRTQMHQILELTFKNASVCPAVKKILKRIDSAQT
jgi:Fe-S-cluster containining protein